MPSDQMSLRSSAASPRNTSGAMYCSVPGAPGPPIITTPVVASTATEGARHAIPKSSTFTRPAGPTMTFALLMSR
jgi:hypothetical protein